MVDERDVEMVRTGYGAFIAGDIEWLNEHMHENVVWHVAGSSPLAGEYRGREEVLAFLARSVQVAVPEFAIHDIAAGEDHVVSMLEATWRRPDGETFESKAVQAFHVDGGKALESWFLVEDQAGLDAFLG
jgi:ketosteroid isomerase-like protein